MTVEELIEKLKRLDPKAQVECRNFEGDRDYVGSVELVDSMFDDGKVVLIDSE